MAHYLASREDVFMSYPKEPSFWSSDYASSKVIARLENVADYEALFYDADSRKHKVVLEASTIYLRSAVALPRILEFAPEARFIAMVRHPVELAHAFHMEQMFASQEDVEDFEVAWRLQDDRRAGRRLPTSCRDPKYLMYRDIAAVGEQIERFCAIVPEHQRLILFMDDLCDNARSVYLNVLDFLRLPDDGRMQFPVEKSARTQRSRMLARLYQSPPASLRPLVRRVLRAIRTGEPRLLRAIKGALVRSKARPKLRAEFHHELCAEFWQDISRLAGVTGRNLDSWLR
jgi:hypothetical protein